MSLEITIKGKYLGQAIDLLNAQTLRGRASRTRSRLIKDIQDSVSTFVEDLKNVVTDLNGSVNQDGTVNFEDTKDLTEFLKQREDLENESYVFRENIEKEFTELYAGLQNAEVSGNLGDVYDELMSSLESALVDTESTK